MPELPYTPERGLGSPRAVLGVGKQFEAVLAGEGITSLGQLLDLVQELISENGNEGGFNIFSATTSRKLKISRHWINTVWRDIQRMIQERENLNQNIIAVYDDTFLDSKQIQDIPGLGVVTQEKLARIEGISSVRQLVAIIEGNCEKNYNRNIMKMQLNQFKFRIKRLNSHLNHKQIEQAFKWLWNLIHWKTMKVLPVYAIDNGEFLRENLQEEDDAENLAEENAEADLAENQQEQLPSVNHEHDRNLQVYGKDTVFMLKSVLLSIGSSLAVAIATKVAGSHSSTRVLSSGFCFSTVFGLCLMNKLNRAPGQEVETQTNPRDIRREFEEFLECSICQEGSVDVTLSCWHPLHAECHTRHLRAHWNRQEHATPYSCPTCRTTGVTASPYKTPFSG